MSVQVETAVVAGCFLFAGTLITQLGNVLSAKRERARETVRWEREEASRREVADREQEERRAEWLRDRDDRQAEWLRDHQRQAVANYLTASDACRVGYVTLRMRPNPDAEAAQAGLMLRYNNAHSEISLLFDDRITPSLDVHQAAFGALPGWLASSDDDWNVAITAVDIASTAVVNEARRQLGVTPPET